MNFSWTFPDTPADTSFTGLFESLFGLTDTDVTLDGSSVFNLAFPEHSLDLDDIDQPLIEPGGPRRVGGVHLRVRYAGSQALTLRVELKDANGGTRFHRLVVAGSPDVQDLDWDFRASGTDVTSPPFDPSARSS